MEQQVKDLVLSLQQLRSLLWHGFNPWPGNFHMPQAWPKKCEFVTLSNFHLRNYFTSLGFILTPWKFFFFFFFKL